MGKYIAYIFVCLFTVSLCFGATYEVIDMGLLESDGSNAYSVDANGNVYGSFILQGQRYDYIWNENDGLASRLKIDEQEPKNDGAIATIIENIGKSNSLGQTIYNVYTWRRKNVSPTGYLQADASNKAMIKNSKGEFIDLGSLGGKYTRAFDINDLGQVVGVSETSNGKRHAFLWENGAIFDLGTMCGDLGLEADESAAVGINNKGQIIGSSKYALVHKGKLVNTIPKTFIYEKGKMRVLFIKNLSLHVEPYGITDSGVVFSSQGAHDVNTEQPIPHFRKPKLIQGNAILSEDGVVYDYSDNNNSLIVNPALVLYSSPLFGKYWKSYVDTVSFNGNNYVIGLAENIYGEKHAVLIRPIQEQL